jgi:hypothetical protein
MAEDQARNLAASRQQIMALASITGVLVAALRQAGLMTNALEGMLASELADAAAAQSEPVGVEWERIVAAVQKAATGATRADWRICTRERFTGDAKVKLFAIEQGSAEVPGSVRDAPMRGLRSTDI